MIKVQYSKKIFDQNNNIVFFISKTKELNNISLPAEVEFDLKIKFLGKSC